MKDIFDVCQLGNLKLNSRIVRSGLWESQADKNYALTLDVYERYEKIASSGVGLIISELISQYPKNKYNKYSHKIFSTNFVHDFKQVTSISHKYNVPVFAQLAFTEFNRDINLDIGVNDLTVDDIRKIQMDLLASCKKIQYAGFDGVQLCLNNNFFLAKMINPYFNERDDDFGGDTFGRMRIILEVLKVLKNNLNLHINMKVNAYDERKGGIDINESIQMCKLLEENDVDSIQISKPLSPLYFTKNKNNELVDYYSKLKEKISVPVIVGGGFSNKNDINNTLNEFDVDFISMYRPFVAENDFLNGWKNNKTSESRCKKCNNCYRQKHSTCTFFN